MAATFLRGNLSHICQVQPVVVHLWVWPYTVYDSLMQDWYHLDLWPLTPIAGGDDSNATAEAIATCAGITPFNSLQGWRIDRHYSAWSTPYSYLEWHFLASESLFLVFFIFFFSPHTHHTTYSGMHWLLVTTQENERKVVLKRLYRLLVTYSIGNRSNGYFDFIG